MSLVMRHAASKDLMRRQLRFSRRHTAQEAEAPHFVDSDPVPEVHLK